MSNLWKIIVILSLEKFSGLLGEICIFPEKNCTENSSLARNLTELSIVHSFLTELPSLDEYENLKILHLDHNQIHTLNRDYPSVEELSLNSNEIYSLHERNLKYFNLKILDLSHNPIEYIIHEYFSSQRFPKLEILILINALTELNPFLIHQRSISFSSLEHLTEIHFEQNQFESFSCSNNFTEIQWKFPSSIRKLNFAKNKLNSFDSTCFVENQNLLELDFRWNYLREFSSTNFLLGNLTKLNLHSNFFDEISSDFLRSFPNLVELDLSNNPLELKKKTHFLPNFLKILRFNSINSELSCSLLKNLLQLEQFEYSNSRSKRVDRCLLKKQKHLKILNFSFHHFESIDERTFRFWIEENPLEIVDIRSESIRCSSCSLRWFNDLAKKLNRTSIRCFNENNEEKRLEYLNFSPCPTSRRVLLVIIAVSMTILLIFVIVFLLNFYRNEKYSLSKYSTVYRMVPLEQNQRIYQPTTEDVTNENVMLVTS